eukprot:365232-Chlamydomonas_euryale.AAC.2
MPIRLLKCVQDRAIGPLFAASPSQPLPGCPRTAPLHQPLVSHTTPQLRGRGARQAPRARAAAVVCHPGGANRDGQPLHAIQGLSQPQVQPAEPRHHPLLQSLHRDHRVHGARRDRGVQPRIDRAAALCSRARAAGWRRRHGNGGLWHGRSREEAGGVAGCSEQVRAAGMVAGPAL